MIALGKTPLIERIGNYKAMFGDTPRVPIHPDELRQLTAADRSAIEREYPGIELVPLGHRA